MAKTKSKRQIEKELKQRLYESMLTAKPQEDKPKMNYDWLIEAYERGDDTYNNGNRVDHDRVASELAWKYVRNLSEEKQITWKGQMTADIQAALEAAYSRGLIHGRKKDPFSE